MLKQTDEGVIIPIKVIPKANRNEIIGWENEELKVRIKAVPEKGNANDELIRFFAHFFQISRSSVTLVYGDTSKHKRICIAGLTLKEVEAALSKI